MFYSNLAQLRKKSNSIIRSRSVTVTNWSGSEVSGYFLFHSVYKDLHYFLLQMYLKVKIGERRKGKRSDWVLCQKPLHRQKIQKATWQHNNGTKNFDYTTIAYLLRTVSRGNDSHPTGVVKPVYGILTFPLTEKAVQSKGHTFNFFLNNPPYKGRGPTAN